MTVEEFFERMSTDGRGVLRGDPSDPDVWIARPDRDGPTYCVCFSNRDGVRVVDGTMTTEDLKAQIEHVPKRPGAQRSYARGSFITVRTPWLVH